MRELARMWRHTRMVVLTAVTGAVYASVLIPFKMFPLIPGTTELRPANALPIVFSFLFGPAGAWGSAMGNLIGDTFGTLGPGTLFGFVGNLLYGFLPYRIWRAWSRSAPVPRGTAGWWTGFAGIAVITSACCALVIGWGLHIMGFVPFPALSSFILVNNLVFSLTLSPLLLGALYPRVLRRGLLYTDLLDPEEIPPGRLPRVGTLLVALGGIGGVLLGDFLSWKGSALSPQAGDAVGWGLLPALGLVFLGILLL